MTILFVAIIDSWQYTPIKGEQNTTSTCTQTPDYPVNDAR